MFDRRITFQSKEADDDPVAQRYKFDSDEERFDDLYHDPQVDLMNERAWLFAKVREPDSALIQAPRLPLADVAPHNSHSVPASASGGQPKQNHH